MTIQEALEFIQETNGKIFSVRFTKRTTGELRTMVARTGVTSKLKGGVRAYEFDEKSLISVYDMQKKDYRAIPIEGITEIKVAGDWQKVVQSPTVGSKPKLSKNNAKA